MEKAAPANGSVSKDKRVLYVKPLRFGVVRYTIIVATVDGYSRSEALGKRLSLFLSFSI